MKFKPSRAGPKVNAGTVLKENVEQIQLDPVGPKLGKASGPPGMNGVGLCAGPSTSRPPDPNPQVKGGDTLSEHQFACSDFGGGVRSENGDPPSKVSPMDKSM